MINLNLLINLRKPFVDTAKFGKFYHLWVWFLAITTTSLMVGLDEWGIGPDGTYVILSILAQTLCQFFYFLFVKMLVGGEV